MFASYLPVSALADTGIHAFAATGIRAQESRNISFNPGVRQGSTVGMVGTASRQQQQPSPQAWMQRELPARDMKMMKPEPHPEWVGFKAAGGWV